jgi:phosphopantothenoylcysteine decarboxylase/phosphopantothenate--cysteine ligase
MNKRLLILSGPTHEYIDPVRFIGNASSGLMGRAIAGEAVRRGFDIDFVTGPVPQENLPAQREGNLRIYKVTGADEMLAQAEALFEAADIAIFAAAVADYAPAERLDKKIAKADEALTLHLRPTPDVARTLCAGKAPGQTAIGFALQTSDGEAHARRKLKEKNLDGIVLNTPAAIGAEQGTFSFLSRNANKFESWGRISKTECARRILDACGVHGIDGQAMRADRP